MPSEANKPTPQFLNAPGDVYQPGAGPAITRYPLVYTPLSATQINYPRLPPLNELHDMDLAYREQLLTDAQVAQRAGNWATMLVMLGSFGVLALIVVGPYVPVFLLLGVGVVVSLTSAAVVAARGRSRPAEGTAIAIFAPIVVTFLTPFLSAIAREREAAAILFGLLTVGAFFRLGRRPLDFYQGWLIAHPRLKPETREKIEKQPLRPHSPTLVVILLIVLMGPRVSETATLAALLVFAVFRGASSIVARSAYRVLGQYVTHGELTTNAPGVWRPHDSLAKRKAVLVALTLPFYFVLAAGLTIFFPIDLMRWIVPSEAARGWDYVAYVVEGNAPLGFFFILPFAALYAFVVPNLLLFAILRPALARLDALQREIEGVTDARGAVSGGLDDDGRTEWQWYVDRLNTSPHRATDPLDPFGEPIREANHLFLGVEPNFKFPILLDRSILSEHCYIVGETGSGKTSLGIMPLALQLLRGSKPRDTQQNSPRPPIVVLDLKGDPALFHTFREECEERSIPFRFFTPQAVRATHYFNAFGELKSEHRSVIQLAQLVLDSLSLSHGEGYGRSYYSRQSRHALLSVLRKHPDLKSFDELYRALEMLKREKKDAFELISTVHALTFYPQLITNPSGDVSPDHVIHMPRVLEDAQVAYFWLPAALESASVREIGKLALYALLTAAIDRQHSGKPRRQAYVLIDEFQRLAGDNFRIVLEQARSFGVSAILANQTQGDLVTPDTDLRPTVRTNTRLKLAFTVTDPNEVRTLVESSGEEVAVMRGWSESSNSAGATWTEALKPRLTRNDVLVASDHPLHFIAHVSRGSGYTQFGGLPIPVRSSYPISADTYRRRAALAWPELSPNLAVGETPIETIELRRTDEATEHMAAQKAKLEELLRRKAPKT